MAESQGWGRRGVEEIQWIEENVGRSRDAGLPMLDAGPRVGEAVGLTNRIEVDVVSIIVGVGKSRNPTASQSVCGRCFEAMGLSRRRREFFVVTSLDRPHGKVREALKRPEEFVIHSLRHTMLTRLGEAGVDGFTIMRMAGDSSIAISQR